MSDIEWGAPIEVNGVRPEWLRDDTYVRPHGKGEKREWFDATRSQDVYVWDLLETIRLPADHPYYTAVSRGFTYWPGGENAPADWDGGAVLQRAGNDFEPPVGWWSHRADPGDIIGYRKRTEQPAPAIAPELVERMVQLVRSAAAMDEYNCYDVSRFADSILAELEPADPDMELAKSINGDVEAITAAIKAARENGQ